MGIPDNITQILNNALGTTGQPYRAHIGNDVIDTDCMVWPIPWQPPNLETVPDAKLEKALLEAEKLLEDEPTRDRIEGRVKLASLILNISAWKSMWQKQDRLFFKARKLIQSFPVYGYRTYRPTTSFTGFSFESIVVAPTTDQFEILRIEQTAGTNYGLRTEDLIARLKLLDRLYGIDITGASEGQ